MVNSGFGIFTSISGTAPNRIFNIEWRAQYFPGSGSANFELRLYEGQSRFDVIYGTVDNGNTSATAGVQRDDTTFVQYFCNGAGMPATGGQSYILQPCGTPSPTPTATATAHYRDGHTDCNRNADCNCHGHTDRNSNSYVHAISYSYAKTHSNPETPHHTKATSDSTASSVTGNTRLEKSNQAAADAKLTETPDLRVQRLRRGFKQAWGTAPGVLGAKNQR